MKTNFKKLSPKGYKGTYTKKATRTEAPQYTQEGFFMWLGLDRLEDKKSLSVSTDAIGGSW